MSQEQIQQFVLAFYRAWLTWVTDGAPEGIPFSRGLGLCASLADYAENQAKISGNRMSYDDGVRCRTAMKNQFEYQGLDRTYPFGMTDFDRRADNDTMHLCPYRVNFVKEMLK